MRASVGITTGSVGLENSSNCDQVAQMRKFLRNFWNERGFPLLVLSSRRAGIRTGFGGQCSKL